MADRSITLKIGANVQGALNGLKTLGQATQDLGTRTSSYIERNEQGINTLSNGFAVAGAAATGFALLAVKKFSDFDSAMSSVKSSGADAAGSIDALRDAAIDAGADTVFSATEAAGAIEELAKAGVSASDILTGGLKGSLDLAAAGSMGVGEAAEYASIAMTQFNLKGKDVGHIADLLAAGAGKAMGEVSDLGQALKQGGLVAAQTGLTLEETTGTLSAFAAAGLLGSDAGTSLKTMLQRLSAPSGEAAGLMEELEISAYGAGGEFVGMTNFAGQLTRAMGDMTPAARQAAMATIFGADAVRAAGVIYDQGEGGIRDWISAVDDQGYAAETAATKLDNLKGDVEGLGGSLETLFIQSGSGVNDGLRSIVQGTDAVVDKLGEIPAPVLGAVTAIVGSGGLVALSIAGMGKMAIAVNNAKIAYEGLGRSAKVASVAAGAVGLVVAAAAVGLAAWAQKAAEAKARTEELQGTLDEFGQTTEATLSSINTFLSSGQDDWLGGIFGKDPKSLIEDAERYGLAIQDLQGYILGQADATDRVNTATTAYLDGLDRTGREYENKKGGIDKFIGSLDGERSALEGSMTAAERKAEADKIAGVATNELTAATVESTYATAAQVTTLEDAISGLSTLANMALAARDSQRGFEAAVDAAEAALKENGATLDITTDKGRTNQAALDGIAAANLRLVEDMQKNGATQGEVQGAVQRSRDEFLRMAGQMGMTADEANALADQLGLIPGNYQATVTVHTGEALRQIGAVQTAMSFLKDKTIDITVRQQAYNNAATASQVVEGRASGGPVRGGELYLVGEEGPELLVMPRSGTVVNARDTAAAIGDLGGRNASAAQMLQSQQFAYSAPSQAVAPGEPFDLTGLQLVGRLDLGNGLEGWMEAVAVRSIRTSQNRRAR
ncbi:phage tail tape measure protein [Oerskovia sp. NPDC060287]|uniref:phage tail tape measure protein n=1 Tax=Oerskovia sp. NPDC060287 TaxID=3347095 RepID=UPI00365E8DF2